MPKKDNAIPQDPNLNLNRLLAFIDPVTGKRYKGTLAQLQSLISIATGASYAGSVSDTAAAPPAVVAPNKVFQFLGPGEYDNYLDADGHALNLTAPFNIVTLDGTAASVLPVNIDLTGVVKDADIDNGDSDNSVASYARTKEMRATDPTSQYSNSFKDERGNIAWATLKATGESIFKELWSQFVGKLQQAGIPINAESLLFDLSQIIEQQTGEAADKTISQALFTLLAKNFNVEFKDSFTIKDANNNVGLKITPNGQTYLYQNVQNFVDNFVRALDLLQPYLNSNTQDYDTVTPTHVFGISAAGTNSKREYFTNLYPEGLVYTKVPVLINGGKKALLQTTAATATAVYSEQFTFELSYPGYKTKSFSTTYLKSYRNNAQNKYIFSLGVGDSITNENINFFNRFGGTWAYFLAEMAVMDNIDIGNINIKSIGTLNACGHNLVYPADTTTAVRGFSEGRSGWASYGHLHYPKWARIDGTAYEDSNAFIGGEAMFYLAGLSTKTPFDSTTAGQTFVAYAATEDIIGQLCTTPIGRYKPDYNNAVWTSLKAKWGYTSAFAAYTGNETACNAEMDLFLFGEGGIANCNGGVCFTPTNAFYNINKAQAYTGSHIWTNKSAFDLNIWLSRYRTLDDVGVRLTGAAGATVTGSDGLNYTIGTLATNTSAYDVCTPTHIVNEMGTNDEGSLTLAQRIAVTQLLNNEIASFSASVKCAYFMPRRPGVMYPGRWSEQGMMNEIQMINHDYITAIQEVYGTADIAKQINHIPAFFTMSPVSAGFADRGAYDMDDGWDVIQKVVTGPDAVHLSAYSLRSIALQVLAWIYWTLQ